jgi:hypothetical protein
VSGKRDVAKVLADRLQELDSEQIADLLLQFRSVVTPLPGLVNAFRLSVERMGPAFQGIARALTAAVPEEPPEQQGEGFRHWGRPL